MSAASTDSAPMAMNPHTMNSLNNNMVASFGIEMTFNWEQTLILAKALYLIMPTSQGERPSLPLASL
jgi:hypothetical protein